jgi:peptidoglycan hydrolase-like protein with peptidoglycan-binding domain
MPLQSALFKGDQKLEAAAVSDPAHIMLGAKGEDVRKIQIALIQLDGAKIDADGQYGPATAAAVLAYKTKRNIINPSYQTQADNIVGKMTMASLDSEMLALESLPQVPVEIVPLSYFTLRSPSPPGLEQFLKRRQSLQLNFAVDAKSVGAPKKRPAPKPAPKPTPKLSVILRIVPHGTGKVLVTGVVPPGGFIEVGDSDIIMIQDPSTSLVLREKIAVTEAAQTFEIKSLGNFGFSELKVTKGEDLNGLLLDHDFPTHTSLDVVVGTGLGHPKFVEGSQHNHKAAHRWQEIRKHPGNLHGSKDSEIETIAVESERLCKDSATPEKFVHELTEGKFAPVWGGKPVAKKHLDWYLDGSGADFLEDGNISAWLRRDTGILSRLRSEIFPPNKKIQLQGHFTFVQESYSKAAEDFQLAFGTIDRVDFEVDMAQNVVRVWFQDRYEWHPFYPGMYDVQLGTPEYPHAGDGRRPSNCIHAAMVEMKDRKDGKPKARDFWMKGLGEIDLAKFMYADIL